MKITDELTIPPESLMYIKYSKSINSLYLRFDNDTYIALADSEHGEGFAKRTKAKIDAYFEAKEGLVMAEFKLHQEMERVKHIAQHENIAQCEVKKPCDLK